MPVGIKHCSIGRLMAQVIEKYDDFICTCRHAAAAATERGLGHGIGKTTLLQQVEARLQH